MRSAEMYEGRRLPHPDEDVFDQGLSFDVETLLGRRRVLQLAGFSMLGAAMAACGASTSARSPSMSTVASSTDAGSPAGDCAMIPEETAGPYPADGSNGLDVLTQSGIVRSDIRSSFGGYSGTAEVLR